MPDLYLSIGVWIVFEFPDRQPVLGVQRSLAHLASYRVSNGDIRGALVLDSELADSRRARSKGAYTWGALNGQQTPIDHIRTASESGFNCKALLD